MSQNRKKFLCDYLEINLRLIRKGILSKYEVVEQIYNLMKKENLIYTDFSIDFIESLIEGVYQNFNSYFSKKNYCLVCEENLIKDFNLLSRLMAFYLIDYSNLSFNFKKKYKDCLNKYEVLLI